jgi:glycosyltransferase involved in cell wall biosynthesis
MKIAILGIKTYPAIAGADRVVEKLIENLENSNEFYIYLSSVDNKRRLSNKDNLHFIYLPTIPSKYLKAFVFFSLSTIHFLFKGKYDIAHIHNSDFGIFNFFIWLKRKTKIIATFHGNPYLRDKWGIIAKTYLKISEKFFIIFSDILTTVSESKIDEIPSSYKHKIIYIPNGIDNLEDFKFNDNFLDDNITKFNLAPFKYIVFACGRLDPTKGLHIILDAYSRIKVDIPLLIIGDFNHHKKYSKSILDKIKNDNRIFVYNKLLPKESLFKIIKHSKFFIFPSLIEAMSMMLLEVISLKVPVICSDIKENISIVGPNYKYLFKSNNVQSLIEKINELLSDPDIDTITSSLYENVKEKFDWKKIAFQYQNLYLKLSQSKDNIEK